MYKNLLFDISNILFKLNWANSSLFNYSNEHIYIYIFIAYPLFSSAFVFWHSGSKVCLPTFFWFFFNSCVEPPRETFSRYLFEVFQPIIRSHWFSWSYRNLTNVVYKCRNKICIKFNKVYRKKEVQLLARFENKINKE